MEKKITLESCNPHYPLAPDPEQAAGVTACTYGKLAATPVVQPIPAATSSAGWQRTHPSQQNSPPAAQTLLGQPTSYPDYYEPRCLRPIERAINRRLLGLTETLPFVGEDVWQHYEVSWLTPQGKPQVAIALLRYSAMSPCLIESKSLKLYFNSLNQTIFPDRDALQATVTKDLSAVVQAEVTVDIMPLANIGNVVLEVNFPGINLDDLAVDCKDYSPNPGLLQTGSSFITETLNSNLLKSNCLVTGQPDWGSVLIEYTGEKIQHEGLLRYLISLRNHQEFHEQCIERIFMDIWQQCQPQRLLVCGRYTRRGGLDINPIRSSESRDCETLLRTRLVRQ